MLRSISSTVVHIITFEQQMSQLLAAFQQLLKCSNHAVSVLINCKNIYEIINRWYHQYTLMTLSKVKLIKKTISTV
ncbi:hypothetical protein T4D_3016 [Trichinella pseudospiralis]|uniref:Uncharacterized protein n=1 Tax=Trichinella pseudospiralis TaxID=6337 RepID=A0A0V1FRS6_TRIPS|nr:hypothetical protein T4D_3016 [Trichinella pseudospiralis]